MNTAKTFAATSSPAAARPTACFSVHGAAEPGLLPRVAGLWAKRGLLPARWHSAVCGPGDRDLYVDIEVAGLTSDAARQIADELRQIWGVSQVLMSLDSAPIRD
jgi:acetolactate synthase small subunit